MDTNEDQIRTLVENWAKAVRAQDMEGAVAHHSADIVMFDVPEPLQWIGIDEYRKTWELFFANSPGGPGSFDLAELQITAADKVAWCHALIKVRRFNRTPDDGIAPGERTVGRRA